MKKTHSVIIIHKHPSFIIDENETIARGIVNPTAIIKIAKESKY